jgi:hypothetical protein
MNEAQKNYRELRHEAEYLSQLLFGDRFPPQHHCEAIETALVKSLAWRGKKAFDQPFWHVGTSDFQSYYASEKPDGRFRVRLDQFASFREVEHWKYAIVREEEKRGIALSSVDAFAAAGFLPWTDTAVIAIALLKQAIRSSAPRA